MKFPKIRYCRKTYAYKIIKIKLHSSGRFITDYIPIDQMGVVA